MDNGQNRRRCVCQSRGKMKWANSQESVYVGWIGTFLFAILTLISLVGCYHSPNVLLTRLFFLSTLLSTSLDLPRYIFLIVDEEYISTIGYSCHILSNYFFFLSLTLVCVVWAHLLQYSSSHSSSSFIYRGQGVITTNVILAIISLITFAFAIKSNSLENFLSSSIYYVYIFIEVLEDLFYSIAVAFFGMKLVLRYFHIYPCLPFTLLLFFTSLLVPDFKIMPPVGTVKIKSKP
jgi:hypothetical protein